MRLVDLKTGRELSPEALTAWLIQRTRFLMGREIPERKPEEFIKEEEEFRSSINAYKTEEQQLIDRMQKQLKVMQEQIVLRDTEIEGLKKKLHNVYRMLDSAERRQGEEIQKSNELRKRLAEIARDMGNPGQTT